MSTGPVKPVRSGVGRAVAGEDGGGGGGGAAAAGPDGDGPGGMRLAEGDRLDADSLSH